MREPYGAMFGAVCRINSPTCSGTGFAIRKANGVFPGLVLTCNHVIENARSMDVSWWDERYEAGAVHIDAPSILVQDFSRDLAVVEVPGLDRTPLRVREDGLEPGDEVINVGYPFGRQFPRFVRGIASGWDHFKATEVEQLVLVLDGTFHCGQSGGPICNEDGEVAAIVYAKHLAPGVPDTNIPWTTSGIGLAVPLKGVAEMVGAGRDMKYRVRAGAAPNTIHADRPALASLQHWLLNQVGSPVAEMSCNSKREVWIRPEINARGPHIPPEFMAGAMPMVEAVLRHRRTGGRFMFNGRTVFAYTPADQAYSAVAEVHSTPGAGDPWTAA